MRVSFYTPQFPDKLRLNFDDIRDIRRDDTAISLLRENGQSVVFPLHAFTFMETTPDAEKTA